MIIDGIGEKKNKQCETCKYGRPLSQEEFAEEMKDCGFTISVQSTEWNCYECTLRNITKINGICQNREPKEND